MSSSLVSVICFCLSHETVCSVIRSFTREETNDHLPASWVRIRPVIHCSICIRSNIHVWFTVHLQCTSLSLVFALFFSSLFFFLPRFNDHQSHRKGCHLLPLPEWPVTHTRKLKASRALSLPIHWLMTQLTHALLCLFICWRLMRYSFSFSLSLWRTFYSTFTSSSLVSLSLSLSCNCKVTRSRLVYSFASPSPTFSLYSYGRGKRMQNLLQSRGWVLTLIYCGIYFAASLTPQERVSETRVSILVVITRHFSLLGEE